VCASGSEPFSSSKKNLFLSLLGSFVWGKQRGFLAPPAPDAPATLATLSACPRISNAAASSCCVTAFAASRMSSGPVIDVVLDRCVRAHVPPPPRCLTPPPSPHTAAPLSFDRTYAVGSVVTGNVVLSGIRGGFDHKVMDAVELCLLWRSARRA